MALTKLENIQLSFFKRSFIKRGPTDANQLNDSIKELSVDLTHSNQQWNNLLVPLTTRLPDGTLGNDTSRPNAFLDSLDSKTIFADSRATLSNNSSYFYTNRNRPYTIFEQLDGLHSDLSSLQVNLENQINNILIDISESSSDGLIKITDDVSTAVAPCNLTIVSISFSFSTPTKAVTP